jgi:uncharacterized protein (DUF58 family)
MPHLRERARRLGALAIRLLTPPRVIRPTREGTWFVLTALGLGIAAMNTGNNLLYLVLAMMLSVIVISGLLSEQSLKRVRVRVEPPAQCAAGEPAPVVVRVANGRRRTPALSVCVRRGGTRGPIVGYCPKLGPGEEARLTTTATFPRRGWQTLEPLRLTTRFPFGLFEKATRPLPGPRVLVTPAIRPVPASALAGVGEGAAAPRRGLGPGLLDLRAFRPGDDLRLVHWRSSARTGALMVRELEDEAGRRIRLEVEPARGGPGTAAEAVVEDDLSWVASLAVAWVRRGAAVGLAAPGVRLPVRAGQAHLRAILRALALYDPAGPRAAEPARPGAESGDAAVAHFAIGAGLAAWPGAPEEPARSGAPRSALNVPPA